MGLIMKYISILLFFAACLVIPHYAKMQAQSTNTNVLWSYTYLKTNTAVSGAASTNITIMKSPSGTYTLYITNGIIWRVE